MSAEPFPATVKAFEGTAKFVRTAFPPPPHQNLPDVATDVLSGGHPQTPACVFRQLRQLARHEVEDRHHGQFPCRFSGGVELRQGLEKEPPANGFGSKNQGIDTLPTPPPFDGKASCRGYDLFPAQEPFAVGSENRRRQAVVFEIGQGLIEPSEGEKPLPAQQQPLVAMDASRARQARLGLVEAPRGGGESVCGKGQGEVECDPLIAAHLYNLIERVQSAPQRQGIREIAVDVQKKETGGPGVRGTVIHLRAPPARGAKEAAGVRALGRCQRELLSGCIRRSAIADQNFVTNVALSGEHGQTTRQSRRFVESRNDDREFGKRYHEGHTTGTGLKGESLLWWRRFTHLFLIEVDMSDATSTCPGRQGELHALGTTTTYPNDYNPGLLESFTNRHIERDYWTLLECSEFTSLCPITGQPDWANLYIRYIADQAMVESKSLKLYLCGFRNRGDFHEDVVNIILNDLIALLQPRYIEVLGVFHPRGGIAIHPFANHGSADERRDLPGQLWSDFARQRRDTMSLNETLDLGRHLR